MADKDIQTTISVLQKIALGGNVRPLVERQRAIDALTLFHEDSMAALEDIIRRTDSAVLKERAELYAQRIKEGAGFNMNL